MRLIARFDKEPLARHFSNFLLTQGIENECEIDLAVDGKELACTVWVYDEDQFEQSLAYLKQFNINPEGLSFSAPAPEALLHSKEAERPKSASNLKAKDLLKVNKQIGKITTGVIIVCVVIFLFQFFTEPRSPIQGELKTTVLPQIPALFSPIERELLYDYPQTFVLLSQLYRLYSVDEIDDPDHAPLGAKLLVAKIQKTPFWPGAYALLLAKMEEAKEPMPVIGPLFENIRQGQAWRLVTPSLLHGDLLHLFFNMLWLFALGPQIEQRLGGGRYLIFIVIAAIISNTAQYLMSGPNFLGFSGVIAAMLGFIWIRQKKAAWEGYFLNRSTLLFVFFFIIAMLVLQILSFAISLSSEFVIPLNIGNTSHIVGGLVGIALGYTSLFKWHPKINP